MSDIMVTKYSVDMTRRHIMTLKPRTEITDEVRTGRGQDHTMGSTHVLIIKGSSRVAFELDAWRKT